MSNYSEREMNKNQSDRTVSSRIREGLACLATAGWRRFSKLMSTFALHSTLISTVLLVCKVGIDVYGRLLVVRDLFGWMVI